MNYKAKYGDGARKFCTFNLIIISSQRFIFFVLLLAGIKKIHRVSDVNAMGYAAPPPAPAYVPNTFVQDNTYANQPQNDPNILNSNYGAPIPNQPQQRNFGVNYSNVPPSSNYYDPFSNNQQPTDLSAPYPNQQQTYGASPVFDPSRAPNSPSGIGGFGGPGASFGMLQQPIVQDMALQYGQKLADHGKQLVESHFEKYVPITRLKYYFAVDNNYVVRKLILLLFPFTHRVSVNIRLETLLLIKTKTYFFFNNIFTGLVLKI